MLLGKKLISRQGSQMTEEMNYSVAGSDFKRSNTIRFRPSFNEKTPLFDDIIPDDAKL